MGELDGPTHINQFLTNHQIENWADKLELKIELFETGITPIIPAIQPFLLEYEVVFKKLGSIQRGISFLSKK